MLFCIFLLLTFILAQMVKIIWVSLFSEKCLDEKNILEFTTSVSEFQIKSDPIYTENVKTTYLM